MTDPVSCVCQIINFIGPISLPVLQRKFDHVNQCESNFHILLTKAVELSAINNDVQKLVDVAEERGDDIKVDVRNWRHEADNVIFSVNNLEKVISMRSGCFTHCCRDLRWRYRLGKEAKRKIEDVDKLLAKKFVDVAIPARNPGIEDLPTAKFVPISSAVKAVDRIIESLGDDTKNIIGVYGPGGLGKTTLVEQVGKRAKKNEIFDEVAMATVTRTPNLINIQSQIAEMIGLETIKGFDTPKHRAIILCNRLKQLLQKKKVLIILDDLWDTLDLDDVGIPCGKEYNGCKVVVVSRERGVCNMMGAQENIEISRLSKDDSWDLFIRKAGDLIVSLEFINVTRKIAEACEGVPNSILTVARAIRSRDITMWNDALLKLGESTALKIEGVSEREVSCLKFSYDQIVTKSARSCLFYCCLFPPYYNVSLEELVIYGFVEGLFENVDSLEEVRTKMLSDVDFLKSSYFLLEGDREGCFKVHDDIRDVVLSIASHDENNITTQAGSRLIGWPEEGVELERCKRMSLMENSIVVLPDKPQCPRLRTLFLQNNAFDKIPERFFKHMTELRHLDLSYTYISSLPESISCLEGLCFLRLENTHLRDATLLSELKKLKVLILRGSCVEQLPKGLKNMSNLKLLDLSNNPYLQQIPFDVISKLSRLEELYIGNSFGEWKVEGGEDKSMANFSELASLAHLTVLHVHIKNTNSLSKNFNGSWGKLRKFRICVSDDYWDVTFMRSMHLKNLSHPIADWVKVLLTNTEHLALARSRDLGNIVQDLNELKSLYLRACNVEYVLQSCSFARVDKLEELHVEYCYSLITVFYLEEIEKEHGKLSRLRDLILVGLPKMTNIWEGNLSFAHLGSLKLMKVKECGKLRSLFSLALAQRLNQLEHLAVVNCDNMEEIISISNEHVDFGPEEEELINISITPLPTLFKSLQKLIVSKCKKMKCVLPMRLVGGLEQLEELTVHCCSHMEEIFANGEEERQAGAQDLLPRLKILSLQNLPKLGALWKGDLLLNCPRFEELQVWNCPNIRKLPLGFLGELKLKKFKGQLKWFEKLVWEDDMIKTYLESLLTEGD